MPLCNMGLKRRVSGNGTLAERKNKIGMTYQWWIHNASNFELQVVMNKVEEELKLRRGYFSCVFRSIDAFE